MKEAMASSLSSPSHLLPSFLPPRNQKPKTLIFSLLSSPKPRFSRKNHLRPKLPPKPQIQHPAPIENPKQQQEEAEVIEVQTEESVKELIHESQSLATVPNSYPDPRSVIPDLALRFAALLAVQTAAAIWLFSSAGGMRTEESNDFDAGVVEMERVREGEVKEVTDFEKVVLEIREMAKEARDREAKEREEVAIENERFMKGSLNEKDSGNGRLGPMKRLGFVRSNVARRKNVGKGFNGGKKMNEGDGASNNDTMGSLVSPYAELPDVCTQQTSQGTIAGIKNDTRASVIPESVFQVKQSLEKGMHSSFLESSGRNSRPESHSQKKKSIRKSVVKEHKDGIFNEREKPWWLKLPFVLAILLRRSSDNSRSKGLYSLKMDSSSDDEDSASYTIAFQDQGDATNFCYLLETFFQELGDFTADVVPLTMKELDEGVNSRELNVLVVRKGQLQLYAGQPLSEVETLLRSLKG